MQETPPKNRWGAGEQSLSHPHRWEMVGTQNSRAAQRSVDRVKKVVKYHKMMVVSSQRWRSKAENQPRCTSHFLWWPWQHLQTFLYFFFLSFFFSKYLLGYHCHLPNDLQHCPQGKMKYEEDSARRKFILAWEDWLWFAGLKINNLKA